MSPTPVQVRYHYAANNPRRASEYELIRDSAAQAGFEVIDGANPDWSALLPNTDIYDAAHVRLDLELDRRGQLARPNFVTGGANNFYGYSNETVDALYEELKVTTDPARQQEILLEIEQNLVADAFGTTIFQFPGLMAYNSTYVDGTSRRSRWRRRCSTPSGSGRRSAEHSWPVRARGHGWATL